MANLSKAFKVLSNYIGYANQFFDVKLLSMKGYIVPQCHNSVTLHINFDCGTFIETVVIVADDTDSTVYICSNNEQAREFIEELGEMTIAEYNQLGMEEM